MTDLLRKGKDVIVIVCVCRSRWARNMKKNGFGSASRRHTDFDFRTF